MPSFAEKTIERARFTDEAKVQMLETLTLSEVGGCAISIARTPGERIVVSMIFPEDSSEEAVGTVLAKVQTLLG